MEQGFLNRSKKVLLKNDGKMGWLLSDLAKNVKNKRKILGRDGKSMKPYQCVKDKVTFADDAAVVMENKNDDGEVGSLIPASIDTSNNHGAAGVIGMNTYARVLVEISTENDFIESLVVAVPIDKNKGHRLKEVIKNTNKEDGFGYAKRKSKGVNQASKANNKAGFRFSKGKPKLIYRHVVKPTNTMVSPSKSKASSPYYSKEDVNVACDKSTEPSNVTNDDSSRSTNENAKPKFIQDDIDLGQLRSNMEKCIEKGSFLEQFLKSREALKNKHHSMSYSDESGVEEVYMPDHILSGGSLDCLEDDLDGYDGYEAQFCDINEQGQVFCDQI
ncbi:hypothetical protein Tco_0217297 [Tanacetum coccineum]